MKKLLRLLFLLLLLGLGFLYIVKNPELPISQTVLWTLGIELSTGAQSTGIDLSGCVSYFDGCNDCSVKDGKPDACTLMYCETPTEPKCNEYATGSESTGSELTGTEDTALQTKNTYIIKTLENTGMVWGQNIYVYDKAGRQIFALLADKENNLQSVHDVTWTFLVIDAWTSAGIRDMSIYDIQSNEKIFSSAYSTQYKQKGNWLYIEWNKVFFATLVYDKWQFNSKRQIATPKEIPTCPSDWSQDNIWYSELRMFNLDTHQLEKTGKIICTFLE